MIRRLWIDMEFKEELEGRQLDIGSLYSRGLSLALCSSMAFLLALPGTPCQFIKSPYLEACLTIRHALAVANRINSYNFIETQLSLLSVVSDFAKQNF